MRCREAICVHSFRCKRAAEMGPLFWTAWRKGSGEGFDVIPEATFGLRVSSESIHA